MLLKTLLGNGFHFFTFHMPHSFTQKNRNHSKMGDDSTFLFLFILVLMSWYCSHRYT